MNQTFIKELRNKKVLVMGLGLHGGGVETARFLAKAGAQVTCTDLRNEETLKSSIEKLSGLNINFVLEEHRANDFDNADIIVKNPAVPSDSPWLKGKNNIETDISLFLKVSESPVLAVTGSKGKSSVVSAMYYLLKNKYPGVKLGGNITVSPLSFAEDLSPLDPVILELSSWQLADLKNNSNFHPEIAAITNLLKDHQNRYNTFSEYEKDKKIIFSNSSENDFTIFPSDSYGKKWSLESKAKTICVLTDFSTPGSSGNGNYGTAWFEEKSGWVKTNGKAEKILPGAFAVPGEPFKINMLFAAVFAYLKGVSAEEIFTRSSDFRGVPYRMEKFLSAGGITCIDDTTATIPDAAAAAVKAADSPVILIAGGNDKELDFTAFDSAAQIPKKIIMLEGSATEKWLPRLKSLGASAEGPFENLESAVKKAKEEAVAGDIILLSPGATSFGMFNHEFERGDSFKQICRKLFL